MTPEKLILLLCFFRHGCIDMDDYAHNQSSVIANIVWLYENGYVGIHKTHSTFIHCESTQKSHDLINRMRQLPDECKCGYDTCVKCGPGG